MTKSALNAEGSNEALDLFDEFAISDEGIWVPYKGSFEFLIARAENTKFSKMSSRLYRKNQTILAKEDETSADKIEDITLEVLAHTVLLGWRGGVLKVKGKELGEYTPAKAKELLVSFPLMANWVITQARNADLFMLKQEAEAVKN